MILASGARGPGFNSRSSPSAPCAPERNLPSLVITVTDCHSVTSCLGRLPTAGSTLGSLSRGHHHWLLGRVARFSLRVREVPGSIPRVAHFEDEFIFKRSFRLQQLGNQNARWKEMSKAVFFGRNREVRSSCSRASHECCLPCGSGHSDIGKSQ